MQSVSYRLVEFFLLFVVFPASLVLDYNLIIKMSFGFLGFIYVIFILLKVERVKPKLSTALNWKSFWKETLWKFFGIAVLTSVYMYFVDAKNLFIVIVNKPLFWIFIVFIYSVGSVYPQELIYRTFFFKRYESLFKSEYLAVFVNAVLFALAHLFFKNTLVLVLTFCGGLLFAFTFKKTRSTIMVSIEHALYGSWLFTVGMGSMLGFPA